MGNDESSHMYDTVTPPHNSPKKEQWQDAVPVRVSIWHVESEVAAHLHKDQADLREVHDALSEGTTHILNDLAVSIQQEVP